ncbi:MAG: monooxygenase [Myxococcales bacterium]|nr:monooxygenase [Myxococcales bacterium]MCB9749120.1 monooxygenase [Myxococcales bacterium]
MNLITRSYNTAPSRRRARARHLAAALLLAACSGSTEETETAASATDGDESTGTSDASSDASAGSSTSSGDETATSSTSETTGEPTEDAAITYHRDVRPVLAQRCLQCHADGKIAPFPLTTYDEVFELRELVALTVLNRQMPPWLAAPDCNNYEGDPTLPQETIDMIEAWVADGAPEGDPGDFVEPPAPPSEELPRVDVELTIPEPYTPQGTTDDYRCFILDWPEQGDAYVTGFRAVPGAIEEVHHAIAFAIPPSKLPEYEALDAASPGSGYECFGGPGGEINDPEDAGIWLGVWVPGAAPALYPEGTGLRIEPGSKVVLQLHYNIPPGGAVPDTSTVQFRIEPTVAREAFMMLWADIAWLQGDMQIPAGAPSTTHVWEFDPTSIMSFLTDIIPSNVPIELHSAAHHMHTLGVRGQHSIRRAVGDDTCLLDIPRWDFNWQGSFKFSQPITFYPTDRLRLECEYDNSGGAGDVNWGDGTSDEMCLGVYYVTEVE